MYKFLLKIINVILNTFYSEDEIRDIEKNIEEKTYKHF